MLHDFPLMLFVQNAFIGGRLWSEAEKSRFGQKITYEALSFRTARD